MNTANQSSEMSDCRDMCLNCHAICTETISHVLHGNAQHSEGKHLVSLLDCAQMCLTHADFMARRSRHHSALAKLCADICRECADLCSQHGDKDGKMKECADVCRKCEQACQQMASGSPAGGSGNAGESSAPQGTGAVAAPTESSGEGNMPVQGTGAGMTQFE